MVFLPYWYQKPMLIFGHFHLDWIEVMGLVGEALFFARLFVQWTSSEAAKKPVLPVSYWYMSLVGCLILIGYAILIERLAVLLPQLVGIFLYSRNLQLELRHRKHELWRKSQGFTQSGYEWPTVSVIIPAMNEESVLAETLQSLQIQTYPHDKLQIIVACNGCTDSTAQIAYDHGATVIVSEKQGMAFGKNFGAHDATGDYLIFLDADTSLPANGIQMIIEQMVVHAQENGCIATVEGRPDHASPLVRAFYMLENRACRKARMHAPGGILAMQKAVYGKVGGFDESIPVGTNSKMIQDAIATGAAYVYVNQTVASTSIRRFAKSGIFAQRKQWARIHAMLAVGDHEQLMQEKYDAIR